jgi:hypothetical protein
MTDRTTSTTEDPAATRPGLQVLEGIVVVVVGLLLLVYVPNALVTRLTSVSRSTRVALATGWWALAIVAYPLALRRRQRQRRGI